MLYKNKVALQITEQPPQPCCVTAQCVLNCVYHKKQINILKAEYADIKLRSSLCFRAHLTVAEANEESNKEIKIVE